MYFSWQGQYLVHISFHKCSKSWQARCFMRYLRFRRNSIVARNGIESCLLASVPLCFLIHVLLTLCGLCGRRSTFATFSVSGFASKNGIFQV